jgi:hypothetical protein
MRRALVLFALLLLALAGCAVGGSSSMVGRWRARRIVDSTACLQSQAPGGGCEKLITVGRDLPPRGFSSLMFAWAAPGYMQQRGTGETRHGLALNSFFEYVRGRGGFALGARLGFEADSGFERKVYWLMPVSVVAHAGGLWGSVYVGGGYAPLAFEQQYIGEGEMTTTLPASYHYNSVHVFAGTRFWIQRKLERGLSFSPEFRVQTFGHARLASLYGNIGLHF